MTGHLRSLGNSHRLSLFAPLLTGPWGSAPPLHDCRRSLGERSDVPGRTPVCGPLCAHSQAALLTERGEASCPPRRQAWWPATQLTAAPSKPSGHRGIPIPREQSGRQRRGLISTLSLGYFHGNVAKLPYEVQAQNLSRTGCHLLRCMATSVNHLFLIYPLCPPTST